MQQQDSGAEEQAAQEQPEAQEPLPEVWSSGLWPAPDDQAAPGPSPEAPVVPPSAPVAASQGIGRRGVVALVLVTALLSATFAAGGTFVAFSLQQQPVTVVADSTSGVTGQVVTLTQSDAIVRVAQQASASVVTIETTGTTGQGAFSVQDTGAGSGFIVAANGLILTNYHVVKDTETLTVTLTTGRQYKATVVSTDTHHDLAIVRIDARGLTPLPLADSDKLLVGQLAIVIGSPLGTFTDSVTQGIVSGLNRSIDVAERNSRFTESLTGMIQTDAAINPGNSGGPLLDAGGNVVGVITAAAGSAQDMGFAVPINEARTLIAAASKA
jgi:putative serine protease PepD